MMVKITDIAGMIVFFFLFCVITSAVSSHASSDLFVQSSIEMPGPTE